MSGEFELGSTGDISWEDGPDLTSVSKEELDRILEQLVVQEREISYQRRLLQGKIDLIRSEYVRRGEAALSPEDLVRILMDRSGGPGV